MYAKKGLWIGKMVIFGLLMVLLFGVGTQFLWNFVMPYVFGLPVISFWQGLAMFILAKLFFGFGGGGGGKKWGGYRSHQMRRQWAEKYSKLSPEERERFKEKFKEKWCSWEENPTREAQVEKGPQ